MTVNSVTAVLFMWHALKLSWQQRISDHQSDSLLPTRWKTISLNSAKILLISHCKWNIWSLCCENHSIGNNWEWNGHFCAFCRHLKLAKKEWSPGLFSRVAPWTRALGMMRKITVTKEILDWNVCQVTVTNIIFFSVRERAVFYKSCNLIGSVSGQYSPHAARSRLNRFRNHLLGFRKKKSYSPAKVGPYREKLCLMYRPRPYPRPRAQFLPYGPPVWWITYMYCCVSAVA